MKKSILLIIISLCMVNMPLLVLAIKKDNVSFIVENVQSNTTLEFIVHLY